MILTTIINTCYSFAFNQHALPILSGLLSSCTPLITTGTMKYSTKKVIVFQATSWVSFLPMSHFYKAIIGYSVNDWIHR